MTFLKLCGNGVFEVVTWHRYFFRVASHRDKEFGRSDCWPNNDNENDNDNENKNDNDNDNDNENDVIFSELRVIATKSLEDLIIGLITITITISMLFFQSCESSRRRA